ncbi:MULTISPECIES: phosphotransferase [unclassified Streptomyces]|uniref:phosphotransferase family protein n=1 Tax=unclassified Streptomyces TaxID=2593676 RepID=UPI002E823F92|nr:phosphotransferase [Streptomyces sp. NBC_00589]WTI39582.1 phosphotransferase [Streptomyces sp. NBC_00775]WUB26739.1 phosphotransferase [Streptomyces sp. NBC_00589]
MRTGRGTGRGAGRTGKLLGSGRSADVYEIDEAWVLRRDREGWGDATAEAAVMEHLRGHGYPVPGVRAATRTDLVMERLSGPTMLEAFGAGLFSAEEAGLTLARLLRTLHAVPARVSADPAVRVLHLDLHPDNVMLTPDGPKVIDWANAEEGPPGLDWGTSAVILAQVAVGDEPHAEVAHETLAAMLDGNAAYMTEDGLAEARARRAVNPTMSVREVQLLGDAEELIRTLLHS